MKRHTRRHVRAMMLRHKRRWLRMLRYSWWAKFLDPDERGIGMGNKTRCRCSCWKCGNPRRLGEKTRQERRADEAWEEERD